MTVVVHSEWPNRNWSNSCRPCSHRSVAYETTTHPVTDRSHWRWSWKGILWTNGLTDFSDLFDTPTFLWLVGRSSDDRLGRACEADIRTLHKRTLLAALTMPCTKLSVRRTHECIRPSTAWQLFDDAYEPAHAGGRALLVTIRTK